MAATDAKPLPIKGQALRITFSIRTNAGALITGATGLDSEVSKDAGAYADCTNEATEIGSSGTYYLDLTTTEMNADTVQVVVKTTSANAVNPDFTFYPQSNQALFSSDVSPSLVGDINQSEATAAARRIYFWAKNPVDGQPLAGLGSWTGSEIQVSKNGNNWANFAGTVTETGSGAYYYEATTGEVDTLGTIQLRFSKAGAILVPVAANIVVPVNVTAGGVHINSATANLIRKNVAFNNYPFDMIDATDLKSPETGISVTAQRSIDGAAFAACANTPAEISNGSYKINLAAADLNGNSIILMFSGTGCHTIKHYIFPQPT